MFKLNSKFQKSSFFIKNLKLCQVRLHDNSKFPWIMLIPMKPRVSQIIDLNKNKVNGSVTLKLYKGNIIIESRQTKSSAYSMKKVSFEENKTFNKSNVEKFINFHKKKL